MTKEEDERRREVDRILDIERLKRIEKDKLENDRMKILFALAQAKQEAEQKRKNKHTI
jgi:hypothetical protein